KLGGLGGAGGPPATAFHAGVLATIAAETGWDPRAVEVMVGTSSGAIAASSLRAGFSPSDLLARAVGGSVSAEGQALLDRVTTPYTATSSGPTGRKPTNPLLVARSLLGGIRPGLAYAGALPRGTIDGSATRLRVDEMSNGGEWPALPTWLCAVRLRDGKRIALGRDDVAVESIGLAVQASSAVPGQFVPVNIAGDDYVDGAVHSTTNVDLLTGLGLDGVVVSSPKSIAPSDANWKVYPTRTYFRRTLQSEIDKVTKVGTPVLTVEPEGLLLELLESDTIDMAAVAEAASVTTIAALARSKKVAKRLASQGDDHDEDNAVNESAAIDDSE
ncbi:MAG: patatin-like phospholipase family protein, partial [Acidimicrobiales bacterium]